MTCRCRFAIIVSMLIVSSACQRVSDPSFQRPGSGSAEEVSILQQKVLNGDKRAAASLSLHYEFSGSATDQEKILWLARAAETGDLDSMNAVAAYAVVTRRCDLAEYWFDKWWIEASEADRTHGQTMDDYKADVAVCRSLAG